MSKNEQQVTLPIDADELVGVAEIAELAGVTKAAVANWRARSSTGFPPPAVEAKSGPLYRRTEVESWLDQRNPERSNGHRASKDSGLLGIESALWATADRMRGSIDTSQYRHLILGLLFLRFVTGGERRGIKRPEGSDWSTITSVSPARLAASLDAACTALAAANPSLAPALQSTFAEVPIDERRLAGLIEVLNQLGAGDGTDDRDILGRSYEYFLGRFASLEGRSGGEFYTPDSVVRLLVEMIEPVSGTVYDPCCGSGGMFVQSARFRDAHAGGVELTLYGQELNAATRRAAIMNLAMHDLRADLGGREADTFHNDIHQDLRVDFVLANPPFNISDWGADALVSDPRWTFGVPPNANANLAWVQHIVWHLNDVGRAGVVLANGSLTSDQAAEQAIRRGLVDNDLIACMVGLPGQLFYSTTIPVTLWFIDRAKPDSCRDRVLFIDARDLGKKVTRTHRVLSEDDIASVAQTFHDWRAGQQDVGPRAAVVDVADIASADYSLSPSRYVAAAVPAVTESPDTYEELSRQYASLVAEALELDNRILHGAGR